MKKTDSLPFIFEKDLPWEPTVDHGFECLEAGLLIDCISPMLADFLT